MYGRSKAELADSTLNPKFRKHLEKFYLNAETAEDRSRCLELLHQLDLEERNKFMKNYQAGNGRRRPFTTIPDNHADSCLAPEFRQHRNPFVTSYSRHYPAHKFVDNQSYRPRSVADLYEVSRANQAKHTTYQVDYNRQMSPQPRTEPAPPTDGQLRNNPHPLQPFMVWRVPRRTRTQATPILTNNRTVVETNRLKLNNRNGCSPDGNRCTQTYYSPDVSTTTQVNREPKLLIASTYQSDYKGDSELSTNENPETTNNRKPMQTTIPSKSSNDSTMRVDYIQPVEVIRDLQVPTTRYGSVGYRRGPALGAIPGGASNSVHFDMRTRSSYDRDYNKLNSDSSAMECPPSKPTGIYGSYDDATLRMCSVKEQENFEEERCNCEQMNTDKTDGFPFDGRASGRPARRRCSGPTALRPTVQTFRGESSLMKETSVGDVVPLEIY